MKNAIIIIGLVVVLSVGVWYFILRKKDVVSVTTTTTATAPSSTIVAAVNTPTTVVPGIPAVVANPTPVIVAAPSLAEAFTVDSEQYNRVESSGIWSDGKIIGGIDDNDYVVYKAINFPSTGKYKIEYSVASGLADNGPGSGGVIVTNIGSSSTGVAKQIPSTGGWDKFQTVSVNVDVQAGTYDIKLSAEKGGFNLDWFKITQIA